MTAIFVIFVLWGNLFDKSVCKKGGKTLRE